MSTDSPCRAPVVGLGLIGSSVALGLRAEGWHVSGYDLDRCEQRAVELGIVEVAGDDPSAELAVIATPVGSIAKVVAEVVARSENPLLIVTDVGSVKGSVVAEIDAPRFVGGHPMAGSEQEGPDGADRDLFAGANWVLTPTDATDPDAFAMVRQLVISTFAAEPIALPPERHDALVALVSHVPHLVAVTLMTVAAEHGEEHAALLRLAAGGFRDMTRIAAGEATMWPDIFSNNQQAILEAFDAVFERLSVARAAVAGGDRDTILSMLEYAKTARRNLPQRIARPEEYVECRVPITDRPGELAKVATILGEAGVNIYDFEIAHSVEGDFGVLILSIEKAVADTARSALVEHGYRPFVAGHR